MKENTYLQNIDGLVYKVMPNHLLKMSPWKDGEDRRIYEQDLTSGYKVITYSNACMIVNNQFNNTTEKWEHKGKKYIASAIPSNKDIKEHTYFLSTLPNHKTILKDSCSLINKLPENTTLSIMSDDNKMELKMVKHKGKICYVLIIDEYLPRVQCYNIFGEFLQWIGIKNCKPIFCETENRYV